jgi:hypothetical protein
VNDEAKQSPKEDTAPVGDKNTNNKDQNSHAAKDPAPFDWITERSSCSLPKVFSTLRSQVEADVKTRDALRPSYSPYEFSLTEDTAEFKVLLKAKELTTSVTFALTDHAIVVRDNQGAQMFEVTLTFDDSGKCRLNVNAQEREYWQVRRMALEDLMFRGL